MLSLKEMQNIHLQFLIQIETIKQKCNGGVLYILIQKKLFLFESLGCTGFKEFIIDNDLNIIDKLLYIVNKFNENDEKINLINLKFSEYEYDRIKRKGILSKLTDTAKDLFHLLSKFSKYHNVKEMTLYAVDNQLQETASDTCGVFQLYFYKNLFDPLEDRT